MGFLVSLSVASALAVEAEAEDLAASRYSGAIWIEPLGSVVFGLDEALFVSLGGNIALAPRTDLVVELAVTHNLNWYGCSSRSTGGFAALGLTFRFGDETSRDGFFLQPKLRARTFSTTAERNDAGWFSCGEDIGGTDGELGLGFDVGYQAVIGPIFLAPVLGLSVNRCLNCPDGQFMDWSFEILGGKGARDDGFGIDVNLNLLRVGLILE